MFFFVFQRPGFWMDRFPLLQVFKKKTLKKSMDFELNELQGTVPVEGWAQVVSQHLMRHGTFHLLKVGSWVGSHVPTGHVLMDAMGEFSGYESYICVYIYIYRDTLFAYMYLYVAKNLLGGFLILRCS